MIDPEVLAIFGISTEVIAKALGDLYLETMKEAIKEKGQDLVSWLKKNEKSSRDIQNASKKYVKNYADRHCHIKIFGMNEPFSLESIYTAVSFLGDKEIHHFATTEGLEEMFRTQGQRRLQGSRKTVDGLSLVNEKTYLMVLGQPGAGKSTFLRRIGMEALKGKNGQYKHQVFPVLLELRRYSNGQLDLINSITEELAICGFPEEIEATRSLLEKGRLLLLLDGLDEVPGKYHDVIIDHIEDFIDQHKNNRFIVSCRTAAYRSKFRRFTDVLMADFDNDQIHDFIEKWFSQPRDREMDTANRCWKDLNKSSNASAKELAQNPLLLTLLCLVYEDGQ